MAPLCYGTWELTCGLEEHTHSEACTPTEPETVYHCGTEAHTHSETCYDEAGELICGLEEHTHSLAAHSDPNADVETASIWAQTFAGVTLTGDWRQDVIAIAETQLGYTESTKNYTVWEDGSLHGYTRYGAWYGSPYGDWCAMFVSFCIHYAEVEDMPLNWGCSAWIAELEQLEQYNPADSDYSPAVGDLVFYDWDQDGLSDHMGLVAELVPASGEESAKLIAIEGNSSNQVRYVTYDLDDPVIMGYGQLPEQTFYCGKVGHAHTSECGNTCSLEEHIHSEECQSTEEAPVQGNLNMILPEGAQIPDGYDAKYSYIDPDNRFGVMVYASEDALPDNAVLSAELLEQGSEAYEAAQQALTDTVYDGFAALDIHFTVDDEEIEPESGVYVCINVMGLLPKDADADSLAVQHHEQTGTALLTPDEEELPAPASAVTVETVADAAQETGQVEALDNSTETTADVAAAFEVENFSTFTITWTHDSTNYVLNLHYVDTAGKDIAPSGIEKNFETVNNTANVTMQNYADMIDHPGYAYQYAYIDNGGVKTAVNKLSYNTGKWYFTAKPAEDDWTLWTGSDGKTSMDVYLVYQPRPEKTLQVSKTLTAADGADADVVKHLENTMEYKFRVVKADANGNPTNQLLIKEGDSYTISGAGLTTNETRTVGEDGYFTLKAGQMAEFADMLARFDSTDSVKKYVVQEVLPTGLTGQYQEVVYSVGSDTGTCTNDITTVATDFTGYNSPAQEADAGNLVNYTNKVDTTKLSTLAITKIQVGSSLDGEPEHYYMQVQLGSDADSLTPISVGTTYFVGDETRSVEQAGIIKIAAGETAEVKLLAGTCYSVVEVADGNGTPQTGSEGYTPAYSDNASGTVTEVGTTVNITVTKTFPTGELQLTKFVNNTADGSTDGEFAFELRFPVGDNWTATDYTAAYTTTNSGQTHTGGTLSFAKQDDYAVATVKLYHGEKVIITGLPAGAQVSITETNADGYSVGWNVNEQDIYGKSVSCSIEVGRTATVSCTNTTGYELPNTGGAGTVPYTTGGVLLLTGAAFLLLYNHTKRRKEDSASS